MSKTQMPRMASEILTTGTTLFAKHKQEGSKSPLLALQNIDYAAAESDFVKYEALDEQAKALQSQAKKIFEERDRLWKDKLKKSFAQAKDMLLLAYSENPATVELWGFPHVKSVTKKKSSKAKVKTADASPVEENQ